STYDDSAVQTDVNSISTSTTVDAISDLVPTLTASEIASVISSLGTHEILDEDSSTTANEIADDDNGDLVDNTLLVEETPELASTMLNPTPRTDTIQSEVDAHPEFLSVTLKPTVQPERSVQAMQESELSQIQLRSTKPSVVEEDQLSSDDILDILN